MAREEGVSWFIWQRIQISCLAQRWEGGEHHIKKTQINKTALQDVSRTKYPVWHMLWWNRNTLCQQAGYKDEPTTVFGVFFFLYFLSFEVFSAILEKSLEKSALSNQLTGGEGGTNRENYPAAPDTQEVGLSRLRMKQALIFLPPPAATVQLCGVYDTKHCIGCSAMVPLPAQSCLQEFPATVSNWLCSTPVLIQVSATLRYYSFITSCHFPCFL